MLHRSVLVRTQPARTAPSPVPFQSAAVADYKPKQYSNSKIKKNDSDLYIDLERTQDIAYELGKIKGDTILVGFAAETDNVTEHAVQKIRKKNFDFIVANDVTKAGAGFTTDTNIITIIDAQGNTHEYPQLLKTEAADIILDAVIELFNQHTSAQNINALSPVHE